MMGVLIFLIKIINVVKVTYLVLSGRRNQTDVFWDNHLTDPTHRFQLLNCFNSENEIICRNTSKKELAQYFHATCFSSSLKTFAGII